MKIFLSDEICQIIELYQKYFYKHNPDKEDSVKDPAEQLHMAPEAYLPLLNRLAISEHEIVNKHIGEKIGALFWEHKEFPMIQHLKHHEQLYKAQYYNDATFLQEILSTCLSYQKARENSQYFSEGQKINHYGYFITSLIVWACEQIDSIRDASQRQWLYKQLLDFLTNVLNKDFIKSAPSRDRALAATIHSVILFLNKKVSDEEDYIKSNKLRDALKRLALKNLCANFDKYLLQIIFDRDIPANLIIDLKSRRTTHVDLIDMKYDEFRSYLGKKSIGANSQSTTLISESEEVFNFIIKNFLKPYQLGEYLKAFHDNSLDDPQRKNEFVKNIREMIEGKNGYDSTTLGSTVFFPTYPVLNTTDSNIDKRIHQTIQKIFEVRNKLYALDFYHKVSLGITDQAGNLAKIFARGELIAWYNMVSESLLQLMGLLLELQQQASIKYNSQQIALDTGHRTWVSNFLSANSLFTLLRDEIISHINDIHMIQQSMSVNQVKKDLERFESLVATFNNGMRNVFGCQDIENPYLKKGTFQELRKRLEMYEEMNQAQQRIQELQQLNSQTELMLKAAQGDPTAQKSILEKYQEILEENKRLKHEEKHREVVKRMTKGLPEELKSEKLQPSEVHAIVSNLQELARALIDDEKHKYDPEELYNFITQAKDKLVDGMRALKRLDFYVDAYLRSNENAGVSFRLGHYHGKTGRFRAIRFQEYWSKTVKPVLYKRFLKEMFQGYREDTNSAIGLMDAYSKHIGRVSEQFSRAYAELQGGNTAKHSLRSYLLAYHKELEHASKNDYSFGDTDFYHAHIEHWGLSDIRQELEIFTNQSAVLARH